MVQPQQPYDLDFDPYSLSPAFLRAIGLVTTATGQTEDTVQELIAGCLGVDFEYGKAVTTHMAMPQRFSALRSAAEIKLDDLDALDELDGLIERCEKAFERRNSVVHQRWCIESKTGHVFIVKETARMRVEADVIHMTVAMVEEIALEMYEAGIQIFLFTKKHSLFPAVPPAGRARHHKSRAARKKRREALLRAAESGGPSGESS